MVTSSERVGTAPARPLDVVVNWDVGLKK